jgi:hypothetical protein
MLVRDPEDCIKAMCEIDGSMDIHSYTLSYEKIRKRIKPIHVKNAHTHFYSLRIFGLIKEDKSVVKGTYVKSPAGEEICRLLKTGTKKELQNKLRYLLTNNPEKGELFRDFESFVTYENIVTFDEIKLRYDDLVAASLIAWSQFAGIIEVDKGQKKMWHVPTDEGKDISLNDFWNMLKTNYEELSTSKLFGADKIFVDVNELRTKICLSMNWSNDKWNKLMTKILDSNYGTKIRLYGSIPSEFEKKENFKYDNKWYALIRIKD